jgi:hypothetical protein
VFVMPLRQDQLVGRWGLVSWRTILGEQVILPLGSDPVGILVYTDDGCVTVQIAARDRPPIAVDPLGGTPLGGDDPARAAAYGTSLAYYGRYEVRGETVVHTIELSSYPNWTGEEQIRFAELADGGELTLRTAPIHVPTGEIVSELRWARSVPARRPDVSPASG